MDLSKVVNRLETIEDHVERLKSIENLLERVVEANTRQAHCMEQILNLYQQSQQQLQQQQTGRM